MKFFLTTTIAICLFVLTCRAQNTFPFPSSGSVGIGTTTPGALLDVSTATGSSMIAPTTFNITSTTSASDWDPATPWGIINFYSKDASGPGASPRAAIGAFMSSAAGSAGRLGFFTNNGTANTERLRIDQNGNLGIGNLNPAVPLHVGAGSIKTLPDGGGLFINPQILNSQTSGVAMIGVAVSDGTNNPRVGIFADQPNNVVGISASYTSGRPDFVYRMGGSSGELFRITGTGKVGIGTAQPDQALTVNGTIHSTAVLVDVNVPVPDYVFNKTYSLRPLADVKTFVDKNHHLPEVPSAAEFKKDGQNLGEMNMILLKKVEELTLYLIEDNKQIKKDLEIQAAQQKELTAAKEQIKKLQQQIISIKTKLGIN